MTVVTLIEATKVCLFKCIDRAMDVTLGPTALTVAPVDGGRVQRRLEGGSQYDLCEDTFMRVVRGFVTIAVSIAALLAVTACESTTAPGSAAAEKSVARATTFQQCTWIGDVLSECHWEESQSPSGCDIFGNCVVNCTTDPNYCSQTSSPPSGGIGSGCPTASMGGCSGSGSGSNSGGSNPPPPAPTVLDSIYGSNLFPSMDASSLNAAFEGCKQDPNCLKAWEKIGKVLREQGWTEAGMEAARAALKDFMKVFSERVFFSASTTMGHTVFGYTVGGPDANPYSLALQLGAPELSGSVGVNFNVFSPPPGAFVVTGGYTLNPGLSWALGASGYACGTPGEICITAISVGVSASTSGGPSIQIPFPLLPKNR